MKKRLTKVQKRMQVLRDALAQIKIGFLKPSHSGIVLMPIKIESEDESDGREFLRKLKSSNKSCNVCARGSLLLASISRFDKFKTGLLNDIECLEGSFQSDSNTDQYLLKFFNESQLMMMETAFEGAHNSDEMDGEMWDACIFFHDKYKTPKNRLIAILTNAIKNKGTFIP